jgi:hypothetical protein
MTKADAAIGELNVCNIGASNKGRRPPQNGGFNKRRECVNHSIGWSFDGN